MSAKQTFVLRGQLRKIVGSSAIDTIEAQSAAIAELQEKTAAAFAALAQDLKALEPAVNVFHRSLLGRLTWILSGR